ncbi:8006_t:CDS:2 [Racocetra fulgida]|uniref:8006_t:CDS:1 n=1 Tax=Racocetra fulgida TaxID=60492 RepID=A0A9N9DIG0_9GLOM|nr:8006_t:CDS:2 [Racocetra fulgida]
MGISPSTVSKIVKKFKETGKVNNLPRSGYPKIVSSDKEKLICEMIIPGQCETAVNMHAKFCRKTNKEMSVETIRNILRRNGYVPRVSPALTDQHKIERLKFATKYKDWTHMVWGCMTSEDGHIELVERTLNSAGYINILKDCLLDVLESCEYDEDEMIFQHDNARIHTSIATKAWLKDNNITVLE